MTFEVFFSYRRADCDRFMRDFIYDLLQEVRALRGFGRDVTPVFFDQESIEVGNDWDEALLAALKESHVLVPLYSPAYFDSEYCGKEWQVFQLRREALAQLHRSPKPKVILPVVWIPTYGSGNLTSALPDHVSDAVKKMQYTCPPGEGDINKNGLWLIARGKSSNPNPYLEFVRSFALAIKNTIEEMSTVPRLREIPIPPLDKIPSAFQSNKIVSKPTAPAPGKLGFRSVRFIYAALHPDDLDGGRNPDPYLDIGGSDWKPFYPKSCRRIGNLAQNIVTDERLEFDADAAEFGKDLVGAVEAALKESRLVVIFVDRWSLFTSTTYQDILRNFDTQNFRNCAVLLPWNPDDPELTANKESIDQAILDVLHFHHIQYSKSSAYACKYVGSPKELKRTLRTVLIQIQANMRNTALVRPVVTGMTRPIVNGPVEVWDE